MSLNPIPKIRTNVPPEQLTWNEHFYTCLAKGIWVIATLVLFAIVMLIKMMMHALGGIGDLLFTLVMCVAGIYIVIALPASIIYACIQRKKYSA